MKEEKGYITYWVILSTPRTSSTSSGILTDIEILAIQIVDLLEILLLHLPPRIALLTRIVLLREQQLVDDHSVGVDLVTTEFLDHALRFV